MATPVHNTYQDSTAVLFTAFCPQYNTSVAENAPLHWSDPYEVSANDEFIQIINAVVSWAIRCHGNVNIIPYSSLHISKPSWLLVLAVCKIVGP